MKISARTLRARLDALLAEFPHGGRMLRKTQPHRDNCSGEWDIEGYCSCEDNVVTEEGDANLICSDLRGKGDGVTDIYHKPVIDIDLPCSLVESSPGKFHLYIDAEVSNDAYFQMLLAMSSAGIVEHGYYNASKRRGYSAVRHPDHLKGKPLSERAYKEGEPF